MGKGELESLELARQKKNLLIIDDSKVILRRYLLIVGFQQMLSKNILKRVRNMGDKISIILPHELKKQIDELRKKKKKINPRLSENYFGKALK